MEKTNRSVLTTRYFVMIITMIMMLFAGTLKEPTIVEAGGSASAELDAIYIDGIKLDNFVSNNYNYDYRVAADFSGSFDITVDKKNNNQIVINDGTVDVTRGTVTRYIFVVSEDGNNFQPYQINFVRDNTSLLKDLNIEGFSFRNGASFDPHVLEYNVDVFVDTPIKVKYETFNDESVVTVTGDKNLSDGKNVVEVLVRTPGTSDVTYTLNVFSKPSIDISFKNQKQIFKAPANGLYKLDLWGAQSGSLNPDLPGGFGDYVSGVVRLEKDEILYLYTGGTDGYNGGGTTSHGISGGGATDIRVGGDSINDRIIVAAGGGASSNSNYGGAGGNPGQNGNGTGAGKGATHTNAGNNGQFGLGENSLSYFSGGGGFFGGGASTNANGSGGGGSSYIYTTNSHKPAGYNPDSKYRLSHPYYTEDKQPSIDGDLVDGHEGNGHIRITSYFDEFESNTELLSIKINGEEIKGFDPAIKEYTIEIEGEETKSLRFDYEKKHINQEVSGDLNAKLTHGDYTHRFNVQSADKLTNTTYTINFKRKPSNKLQNLSIEGYKLDPVFDPNTNVYYASIASVEDLKILAQPFDNNATVKVRGALANDLVIGNNEIKITVSRDGLSDYTYTLNAHIVSTFDFPYTGKEQTFIAPSTGLYQIELWGARGQAANELTRAKGAYVSGNIELNRDDNLYLYVGQGLSMLANSTNFNAGTGDTGGRPGGGATDIRLVNGVWNNFNSLKSRIMVAAGSGSAIGPNHLGYGGGLTGGTGGSGATGGTQTSPGRKAMSQYANSGFGFANGGAGGGNGYYGGGAGNNIAGAGGGSSFISGYPGVNAIAENSTQSRIIHTGQPIHYSGYTFTDGIMIPGNQTMPNYKGGTMIGNDHHGYARITMLKSVSTDKTLESLRVMHEGTEVPLLQDFDPLRDEYDLVLDPDQFEITILATPNDKEATVAGDIDTLLTVPSGDSEFSFTVTGADGSTKTYYINVHRSPSSYPYLADLTLNGETVKDFEPTELEYEINLPYNASRKAFLGWTIARPDQEVIGDEIATLVKGEPIIIRSWAEDKINFVDYKIFPNIEDTNLLRELNIEEVGIGFESEKTDYDIHIPLAVSFLTIDAIPFDDDATAVISGSGYLRPGPNTITITVEHPRLDDKVYTLQVLRSESAEDEGDVEYDYVYTGDIQYFIVPYTGDFKLETWGAQGGNRGGSEGGRGGYSVGTVNLQKDDVLAVYVGGSGSNTTRGYNGGGVSGTTGVYGGGSSDIRVKDNGYDLNDRIIVAGGGGSVGARNKPGGAGGGYNGIGRSESWGSGGQGASASSAGLRGAFGKGGNGVAQNNGRGGAGGGGFYGGGGVTPDRSADDDRGGGGGSGYVVTEKSHKPVGYDVDSKYYAFDENSIPGNSQMPNKSGGYTTGNLGNGFVRITGLRRESNDNYLSRIDLEPGYLKLDPVFDSENNIEQTEFDLYLDSETAEIKINGVPMDPRASVQGNDNYIIESGTNAIELIVTAENGDIRIYTINTHREKSSNGIPRDIKITGLVPSLCKQDESYCVLNPTFDVDITPSGGYRMIVPGRIEEVEFTTIKAHPFQVVVGGGVKKLETNVENEIEITVTSEDGAATTTYKFIIVRDMSGNADLRSLNIIDPETNLNFNKDITEYYISIPFEYDDMDLLEFEFEPYDELATAELITTGPLELGLNEIEIKVTSENGKIQKIYRVFAYRELSENTFIEDLRVYPNDGESEILLTPHFDKVIEEYFLVVGNEVDRVRIEAETSDENTTIDMIEDGLYPLEVGSNKISIETTAQDGETQSTYEITIVRRASTNNNIEEIHFDNKPIEGFNKTKLNQTIIIDSQYIKPRISAKLEDKTASYKISGAINGFDVGDNVVYFKVTAESGTEKTYTVNFYRPASDNTKLTIVSNNLFNVAFDKDVREYFVPLQYTDTLLNITGIPEHTTSTIKGEGSYTLVPGENEIILEVTAENGDVGTYTFIINMMKNNDASLADIELSDGTLSEEFSPNIYEYDVIIPEGLPNITVTGIPKVKSTIVEGNQDYVLAVGDNVIKLTAKADGGSRKTYTLNIHRTKSKDATLSNIVVREGSLNPDFESNIYEYTVYVPNGTRRVEVIPTLSNANATVMVLGNDGLALGENLVYVRVSAEDKSVTNDYILKVIVQDPPSENTDLEYLKVNKGELSPTFSPNIKYYNVDVDNEVETITVDAKAKEGEIVSGLGEHELEIGQNMIVVSIMAENGVINDYQIEVTRLLSTNTQLESLEVLNSERGINFKPNVYEYEVNTFGVSLNIKAKPAHPNATVEIIGNAGFITGETQDVIVRVTSEDGNHTKDYVLVTHKLKSVNNNLLSLEILGATLEPEFNASRTTYRVNVRHEITQVVIEALAEDPNATVDYDHRVTLDIGKNYVDITVTAENGSVKTYTVEITRDGSYVRDLDSIIVNQEPILNFDKVITEYNLEVEYETDSVYIDYEKSDENSTVFGGGEISLNEGLNIIKLVVTSQNGDTKIYTLNITRKSINSAKIKNLEVGKYLFEQNFNKDNFEYDIFVNNEIESLDLLIELKDPKAVYEVKGNKNFKVGSNTVEIEVNSSSRDKTETYILNVIRYAYANNFLVDLSTSEGELSPEFDPTNHIYHVEVDSKIDTIQLNGLIEPGTTVSGLDNDIELNMGENHLRVTVMSDSGISRTYHVFVNRSLDNARDLLSLEVSVDGNIYEMDAEFDSDTLEYTLVDSIPVGTEFVNIRTSTSGQTVVGDGRVAIIAGENRLDITVTSESGFEKTYSINLYREKSENNFLTDIVPSSGNLAPYFIYSGDEYELRVDSSVNRLHFNVSVEDKNARVSGHETQLVEPGQSERIIKVTSESNEVKEYRIVIIKEATNNALLKTLDIVGHGLGRTFDPHIFEYDVILPHNKLTLTEQDIVAEASDGNSRVHKGTSVTLNTVSPTTYEVVVVAVDGYTKETYRINAVREKGNDATIKEIEFGMYGRLDRIFRSNQHYYELEFTREVEKFDPTVISRLITTDSNSTVSYSHTEPFAIKEGEFVRFTITVLSEDKSDSKEYHFDITSRRSTDSKLSSLRVEDAILNPGFNPDILEYSVSIDENLTTIPILAQTRDEKAIILTDLDDIDINQPKTVIEIVVQSEKGDKTTYKLTINRDLTRSVELLDVKLNNAGEAQLTPNFDNYYDTFTAEVSRNYESIGLIVEKGHPSQSVVLFDKFNNELDLKAFNLNIGLNEFRLEVRSAFEETRDIHLQITRSGEVNNSLSHLEVLNPKIDLEFSSSKLEYYIEVNNLVNELELEYTPERDTSTVEVIGNSNFKVGLNDVIVRVTNEMKDSKDYIIHVLKGDAFNNFLETITVSNKGEIISDKESFSPTFSKYYTDYSVTVDNVYDRVTIEGVPEEGYAKVEVTGGSDTAEILDRTDSGVEVQLRTGSNIINLYSKHLETEEVLTYTVNVIREKYSGIELTDLQVFDKETQLEFDQGKFDPALNVYTLSVTPETTSLIVSPVLLNENSNARIEVFGNKYLVDGLNYIRVVITSEDKTKMKVYTIEVSKEKSNVNTLDKLSAQENGKAPYNFDLSKEDLVYEVGKDVSSIILSATPTDPFAIVSNLGVHALIYGENQIDVTVTAQNGDVKVYKVNIIRAYDNSLRSLTVTQGQLTPEFNEEVFKYTVEVPEEINEIGIFGDANNPDAVVEGTGFKDLNMGENNFTLRVKSTETSYKDTTVTVIRKPSENAYLKLLNIEEGALSPRFDKSINKYTSYIKNTHDVIHLDVLVDSPLASFEISNLSDGDFTIEDEKVIITNFTQSTIVIKIKVTSASGLENEYSLTVYRQEEAVFSNKLKDLVVKSNTPTVEVLEMTPKFDPDTSNYIVGVNKEVTSINISGIRMSQDADILDGFGDHDVKPGMNIYNVRVLSKDGIENSYQIIIHQDESSDAYLDLIEFKEGNISPIFDSRTLEYNLNVDSNVQYLSDYTIRPRVAGTTYTIEGHRDLKFGQNEVIIKTTSASGLGHMTYKVNVNRDDNISLYLEEISSSAGIFKEVFNKQNMGPYTLEVSGNTNSVILEAIPESKTGISNITNINRVIDLTGVSEKRVEIKVIGDNGKSLTYVVDIKKNYDENSYLTNLWVSPGKLDPEFKEDIFLYHVNVDPDTEFIEIKANTDLNAEIIGLGTKKLKIGINEFVVSIITPDGTILNTYTIIVERESVSSSKILELEFEEVNINAFDKDTTNYTLDVPYGIETLNIGKIVLEDPENSDYTIKQTPSKFTQGMNNKIEIEVVNKESNDSTLYTFTINSLPNVSNRLVNIRVSNESETDYYALKPIFNSNTLAYEVSVPYEISKVKIHTQAESANATVGGGSGVLDLEVGENTHIIRVVNNNIAREYIVRITRAQDPNNYLASLTIDKGLLSPEFKKDTHDYTLNVDPSVDFIDIEGLAESVNAEVIGNGTVSVSKKESYHSLIVVAQDGNSRTYKIKIVKEVSEETGVINITPTHEDVEMEFDPDVFTYDLVVDEAIYNLGFIVETEDENALVSGHEAKDLSFGENEFIITVNSQSGDKEVIYTINVRRLKSVKSLELNPNDLVLEPGQVYEDLEVIYDPIDADDLEVTWETTDESIVIVDENGVITAIDPGSAEVIVTLVSDPTITARLNIEVMQLLIESDILEIDRERLLTEEPYKNGEYDISGFVVGSYPGTNIQTYKEAFINKPSTLKLYDKDGIELTESTTYVGTHLVLRLEINGKVYDELMIFVRGDGNGDGAVNIIDVDFISSYIQSPPKDLDDDYYEKMLINIFMDVSRDSTTNVVDMDYIMSYIIDPTVDLNKERD